jgi:hypothetical protein
LSGISRAQAIELLNAVEKKLRSFQNEGLELEAAEQWLDKAKAAISDKDQTKAIFAINELGTILDRVNKCLNKYSELAAECRTKFDSAEKMNVEITRSKELIIKAQKLFRAEKFPDAIQTLKDCKKHAKDSLFLFITDEIKSLYNQFKQLPKNVLQSRDIQKLFTNVDDAIMENRFGQAWEFTIQLKEIKNTVSQPIAKKLREQVKDDIIEFQNEIEEARVLGADLTDVQEVFDEIVKRMKTAHEVSELKEVIDYAAAGKRTLERAMRRKSRAEGQRKEVQEMLDRLLLDYEDIEEHCAIPKSVDKLISKTKSSIENGNFEEASKDIETCKSKLDKLRKGSEPKVDLKFEVSNLQPNIWNRTQISITNCGLASARDVTIKLSGPIEVRRLPILEELDYNQTLTYEIGLKIDGAGSVPVDIDIDYTRTWDGNQYHEHRELWMNIGGPDESYTSAAPASISPAITPGQKKEREIACIHCNRPITKSTPIFKCDCGTIYHLGCVTNLKRCLKCDRDIEDHVETISSERGQ